MERFNIIKLTIIILALFLLSHMIINTLQNHNNNTEQFRQKEKFLLKQNNDVYDRIYAPIYQVVMEDPKKINYELSQITDLTHLNNKSNVLDIGCGVGGHLIHLSYNYPSLRCLGLDKSKSMINYARREQQKYLKHKHNLQWVHGDALNPYLFNNEEFTHIFILQFSIYCIKDKDTLFNHCYNWLQPGGYCIIHLVNKYKFDPMVNPANPFWMISPQKYAKQRITQSKVIFDNMTYSSDFKIVNPNVSEFIETITDHTSQKIRKNKHTLFMDTQKKIIRMSQSQGFSVIGKVNLNQCGYDEQYLYILRKD